MADGRFIRDPASPQTRKPASPHFRIPSVSFILLTATTEPIRGLPRARLNEAYTDAIVATGLVPLVLPPVAPYLAERALDGAAGLVLTGGEDVDPHEYGQDPLPSCGASHRGRDHAELALARHAQAHRIPTLAICRGAQVMNVALGGTLVQDIATQRTGAVQHDRSADRRERVHGVRVVAGSRLAETLGTTELTTNSSHHQSVDRVAPPLRITAHAEDGIVEGLEPIDRDWWMLAVQWHPEELIATAEDWDRRLFEAFAQAAQTRWSETHHSQPTSGNY